MLECVGQVLDWARQMLGRVCEVSNGRGNKKERRESRDERRGNREKIGERVLRTTWTPCQHLMIILTLFDHINSLNHDKA